MKRNLERQLREVEDEMDVQRQELSLGYEEAMRKREHEFRVQADEMRGSVLSHDLQGTAETATVVSDTFKLYLKRALINL